MHNDNCNNCDSHKAAPQTNTTHSELETIKNEINAKLGERSSKGLPVGSILVTVILGVLTLVSVGQMVESVYIFNKLKSGNITPASNSAPQTNSPQSAPDMVGGC